MMSLLIGLGVMLVILLALLSNTRERRRRRRMKRLWRIMRRPEPSMEGLRATAEYQRLFQEMVEEAGNE